MQCVIVAGKAAADENHRALTSGLYPDSPLFVLTIDGIVSRIPTATNFLPKSPMLAKECTYRDTGLAIFSLV